MHILDILGKVKTVCSFEFFPPRSEKQADTLYDTISELEPLKPSFVSVTYGAGGSTRELTHGLVLRIKSHTTLDPIPHLTCVEHTREDIRELLVNYGMANISNILALKGDPVRDLGGYPEEKNSFKRAADLVSFIKTFNSEGIHPDPRGFGIGVAGFPEGHPETPNRLREMDYLKEKMDAGADYICTQLFFDNRDFYDFRERCELLGIHAPIIAGIMPVTSIKGMKRMAELAGGTRFPARLIRDLERCQDDPEAVREIGIHHATEQCRDLIHNKASGIHFYTLNKSDATLKIYKTLGMRDSASIH